MRASIVARARFIADLVADKQLAQYVLLGAGLDWFAQRESPVGMQVFEVEQPGTQVWKQARLNRDTCVVEVGDRAHGSPSTNWSDQDRYRYSTVSAEGQEEGAERPAGARSARPQQLAQEGIGKTPT